MDVDEVIRLLSEALRGQYRSALLYTLAAGSVRGLDQVALADLCRGWAAAELDDARRLVEKIVALGADTSDCTDVVGPNSSTIDLRMNTANWGLFTGTVMVFQCPLAGECAREGPVGTGLTEHPAGELVHQLGDRELRHLRAQPGRQHGPGHHHGDRLWDHAQR